MIRNRTDFTPSQRAKIYKRDHATCCFSGANLWLLDGPIRTSWEADWADHKRPASRGGKSDISNGVCSSATYNVKKRNNSADTTYLFEEGQPTALYFSLFGSPPSATTERLIRLSALVDSDWFFNRAINSVMLALEHICWSLDYKRDDKYYFRAAYTKILDFQKKGQSIPSLNDRGIITSPTHTQSLLLSLGTSGSLQTFTSIALQLLPIFEINSKIWHRYFHPEEYVDSSEDYDSHRRSAYTKACTLEHELADDTFGCIQADFKIRFGSI